MPSTGKVLLIGALMKMGDNNFKPRDLKLGSNLSPQLINYHLKQLIEAGAITQDNKEYWVSDKEVLIDILVHAKEADGPARALLPEGRMFRPEMRQKINSVIQILVWARGAGIPVPREVHEKLRDDLFRLRDNINKAMLYLSHETCTKREGVRNLNKLTQTDIEGIMAGIMDKNQVDRLYYYLTGIDLKEL